MNASPALLPGTASCCGCGCTRCSTPKPDHPWAAQTQLAIALGETAKICQLSVVCKTCASTPAAARWRASGCVAGAIPKPRIAVAVLRAAGGCHRRGCWRQRRISSEHCEYTPWVLGGCARARRSSRIGLLEVPGMPWPRTRPSFAATPPAGSSPELAGKEDRGFLNLCTSPYS